MTFDLTPDQASRLTAIRQFASTTLAPIAAAIDVEGRIPDHLVEALDALAIWGQAPVDAVLALEEIAAASGSAAASLALGNRDAVGGLAGLRGVGPVPDGNHEQQLGMAGVCLGIGRAALDEALSVSRSRGDRASGNVGDPPHWALADAATEMDAARLLVHAAALGQGVGAPAALVYAGGAASRTVEAALRIVGAGAFTPGAVLDRCGRDIRAALLLLGTEDLARRQAADALFGDAP